MCLAVLFIIFSIVYFFLFFYTVVKKKPSPWFSPEGVFFFFSLEFLLFSIVFYFLFLQCREEETFPLVFS